ncbi:MAG: PIN domain-containing protein [Defluviitaleaceae bacterium]|nr:PIN domain-containing protein [Defluviitaleaceae bacterium]
MKIMVDTNVILDFFLLRQPGADSARRIFEMIYQEKIEAFTTASSITDIYYVTAKKLGDSTGRKAISQLLHLLGIIAVDGNDCTNALILPVTDFEDALVTVCSKKEDIDCIVTNDNSYLQIHPQLAKVVSPQVFLDMINT